MEHISDTFEHHNTGDLIANHGDCIHNPVFFFKKGLFTVKTMLNNASGTDTFDGHSHFEYHFYNHAMAGHSDANNFSIDHSTFSNDNGQFHIGSHLASYLPHEGDYFGFVAQQDMLDSWQHHLLGGANADPLTNMRNIQFPSFL